MYSRKRTECACLCLYDQSYPLNCNGIYGELQNVIRDFKKFTSKKLIEAIQEHAESRREWLLKKFSFEAQKAGRAVSFLG
jgi:hypothetical protein